MVATLKLPVTFMVTAATLLELRTGMRALLIVAEAAVSVVTFRLVITAVGTLRVVPRMVVALSRVARTVAALSVPVRLMAVAPIFTAAIAEAEKVVMVPVTAKMELAVNVAMRPVPGTADQRRVGAAGHQALPASCNRS